MRSPLKAFYFCVVYASCIISCYAGVRLEGKIALITGGSKGIGEGISHRFAQEGATVVLVARTRAPLEQVVEDIKKKGGHASYIIADISKPQEMRQMADETIKKYGRIDILIHNAAGIYPAAPIDQMSEAAWHEAINTNLNGVFYAVKAVLPQMQKQHYGKIVFTSSISGPRVGLPGKSHYTASKGGMNGFMKTIAVELAKDNITVNAVEPGNIETQGLRKKMIQRLFNNALPPFP